MDVQWSWISYWTSLQKSFLSMAYPGLSRPPDPPNPFRVLLTARSTDWMCHVWAHGTLRVSYSSFSERYVGFFSDWHSVNHSKPANSCFFSCLFFEVFWRSDRSRSYFSSIALLGDQLIPELEAEWRASRWNVGKVWQGMARYGKETQESTE